MSDSLHSHGILAGRLAPERLAQNFRDLHPRLDDHEALVAADRCYFCYDAPCITACPTSIDIPLFIRQIATGTAEAAAKTIFDQNILGGMCARVCPTETLCEEACVREAAEGAPVKIGQLQRFATDKLMSCGAHPYTRAEPTGKKVAVVGAGPAGLACAHRLAFYGHEVMLFDANSKGGGLNEFGIAAYKATNDFAQNELEWLLSIGGITLRTGCALGAEIDLDSLHKEYDAVFLGIGLGGVRALDLVGAHDGMMDAVGWIAALRQSRDKTDVSVGRDVVVIGGGMTAVDAAVQSKLMGAQNVTIAYRGPRERMSASPYEQQVAAAKGVNILCDATPTRVDGQSVTFRRTGSEDEITIRADHIMRAIGQTLDAALISLTVENGKIAVDAQGRTSTQGIWAGGDCATGGDDLTVTAVAEGRDAAENMHKHLMEGM